MKASQKHLKYFSAVITLTNIFLRLKLDTHITNLQKNKSLL